MPFPPIRLEIAAPSVVRKPLLPDAPRNAEKSPAPATPALWPLLNRPASPPFPPEKIAAAAGANFMPTNAAAMPPSTRTTCSPLLIR